MKTKFYNRELSWIDPTATFGEDCVIHGPVWIGANVRIGNRVKIQAFTFIPEGVTILDDVFIGPHVCFTNDPDLAVQGRACWKQTVVKKGAKIGANASVKAGVFIGTNAIVGMGAVVLKDVPDECTVVGNPAKPIKKIDVNKLLGKDERYTSILDHPDCDKILVGL